MNLCAIGHDEVCYEGRNCPFCTAIAEWDEEKDMLNDRIKEAEDMGELAQERLEKMEASNESE